MDINIDDNKLQKLSTDGKDALKIEILKYTDNLIKESILVAEEYRETGAREVVTDSDVIRAARKKTSKSKKKWYISWCRVLSPITFAFAGWLFDENGFNNNKIKFLFFLVVLIIAVSTTIVSVIKEE